MGTSLLFSRGFWIAASATQPLPLTVVLLLFCFCPPPSPPLPLPEQQTESFSLGATPTTREAQAIADEIFADFVSAEVDKVELVYTKFVSLITSTPTIQVCTQGVCCGGDVGFGVGVGVKGREG